MKRALVAAAVLAVIGVAVFLALGGKFGAAVPAAKPGPAQAPEPVKAAGQVAAEGRVVPVRSATLSFAVGGVVAEVFVKEGDQIQAGQLIARLSNGRQQAAVAQAEAEQARAQARVNEVRAGSRPQEIEAAQAALEQAQAALAKLRQGAAAADLAEADAAVVRAQARVVAEQLQPGAQARDVAAAQADLAAAQARLERLQQGPTVAELAQAEAQVKSAQAQLDLKRAGPRHEAIAIAEADLAGSKPQIKQAQIAFMETELRAPFPGIVATLDLKPGQYVGLGAASVRLADLSQFQIETEDLTELKVARVQEGAPVRIKLDALPGAELTGRVAQIKPMGEKKQGDVTYTVVVRPDTLDGRLRWNMTAALTFEGK